MTEIALDIENIGGIDDLTVTFEDGVTLVQGPNATNKTSLLQSVLFALGSSSVPIRSGADEARVELRIGDRTVERTAHRAEGGVRTGGDTWVEEGDERLLLERFAALLETNPLRAAVRREQEIEPLLKEPMNIDALEAERAQKMQHKRELEARVEELADVDDRLAEHEQELESKRDREAELEAELEELEARREAATAPNEEDDHLAELREQRADLRSQKADCQEQIGRLEDAIDRLEEQLEEVETDIEAADEADEVDIDALKQERAEIRSELEDVEARLDILQSVLTANREMLDSEFTGVMGYEAGLTGDEFTCWACGGAAERADFEGTVEELQDLITEDKQRLREREPEIEDLDQRIEEARRARSRRQELAGRRRDLEQKVEERRDSLDQQRSRLEELRSELQSTDDEIAEHEAERTAADDEVTEKLESTRVDIRSLRRELDRLERTRDELEEKQREREENRERIETLEEEIATLTDRIENLEEELRGNFNAAMDDLLSALAFERIERVWLDGNFDLVIAREVDGSVRADAIEHLAESEREMIGLVLGLAGFVTYDVGEVSPVLVLDSLGAFDAERTERLIDYFSDRTDVLLAAVHPATTEGEAYERVTFERPMAD
ncbi:archaea-specific SMC-related protein [Haloglomus litoreum]|uniref:archaea-specific SMC-related protein n=1 Tax=Haloglomus litoreum TaxID=3034026 RepID=UPI0023E7CF38|nr:archaea-specific SMC-related protein [Haloglomus sp. DT116]